MTPEQWAATLGLADEARARVADVIRAAMSEASQVRVYYAPDRCYIYTATGKPKTATEIIPGAVTASYNEEGVLCGIHIHKGILPMLVSRKP